MKPTIKEIKKELGLNDSDIAQGFGYKNAASYSNSSAKKRIEKGLEWFYEMAVNRSQRGGKEH